MSCLTPKDAAEALPADVLAALDGASVIPRSSQDDNGTAYVIIRLPGVGSWTHGDETPERIAAAFPELSDGQLKRALRFISSRIAQMTRDIHGGTRSRRPNWCTNW